MKDNLTTSIDRQGLLIKARSASIEIEKKLTTLKAPNSTIDKIRRAVLFRKSVTTALVDLQNSNTLASLDVVVTSTKGVKRIQVADTEFSKEILYHLLTQADKNVAKLFKRVEKAQQ